MSTQVPARNRMTLVAFLVLLLILLLIVGFLSVNYSSGLVLLFAFLLWGPAQSLFSHVVQRTAPRLRRLVIWGLVVLVVVLTIMTLRAAFLAWEAASLSQNRSAAISAIREYRVIIEPQDAGGFRIRESITAKRTVFRNNALLEEDLAFSLPERQVAGTSRGLFLNEMRIAPLQVSSSGYISLTLPDGSTVHGPLCRSYCPETAIEVRDLPKGSFYAAKESEDVKFYPYIDTETVSWSVRDLDEGITFAYVPPPFLHLRPVIDPLLGASSLSQWVIGVIGIALAIIVSPVVKPVLIDLFRDRLKVRLVNKSPQQPEKKVKIIISSKGEEKEIRTKK